MRLIRFYLGNFLMNLGIKMYPEGRAKQALLWHLNDFKNEVESTIAESRGLK